MERYDCPSKCGGKITPTVLGKVFKCDKCGNEYKKKTSKYYKWMKEYAKGEGITLKRPRKPKGYDINDKSTWSAKCKECGSKMVYIDSPNDPRYLCRKCGNMLEV